MPELKITLTDTELKSLEYCCLSPQEWGENAITERARIANSEIIQIYTNRALDEGVAIPNTREQIVSDAFSRGWVKTAAQVQLEIQEKIKKQEML